jgi:hypothetical protein
MPGSRFFAHARTAPTEQPYKAQPDLQTVCGWLCRTQHDHPAHTTDTPRTASSTETPDPTTQSLDLPAVLFLVSTPRHTTCVPLPCRPDLPRTLLRPVNDSENPTWQLRKAHTASQGYSVSVLLAELVPLNQQAPAARQAMPAPGEKQLSGIDTTRPQYVAALLCLLKLVPVHLPCQGCLQNQHCFKGKQGRAHAQPDTIHGR